MLRNHPNFCVVLCIVCFVSFCVLFVCVYVYCTTATGGYPIAVNKTYHINILIVQVLTSISIVFTTFVVTSET